MNSSAILMLLMGFILTSGYAYEKYGYPQQLEDTRPYDGTYSYSEVHPHLDLVIAVNSADETMLIKFECDGGKYHHTFHFEEHNPAQLETSLDLDLESEEYKYMLLKFTRFCPDFPDLPLNKDEPEAILSLPLDSDEYKDMLEKFPKICPAYARTPLGPGDLGQFVAESDAGTLDTEISGQDFILHKQNET
ncbi:hypothetical protein FOL47_005643 [Perkinsus chesapeaki]|uniref:Uncharacterized protein n=1 Tax=Perkinsus chesapeaki TaxID=330153 RepID=A0A7J6LXU8_PERCH|nr:hypothetical protein FOL47_005643 [Perkinsus chesapeaki]